MILLCAKRTLGDMYRVKSKFDLNAMQVIEGDFDDDADHTFNIYDDTRNIQLYAEYVLNGYFAV